MNQRRRVYYDNMIKTRYVVGFMFNAYYNEVLLVRKQRPDWQKGKLNGLGGHVEQNERAAHAMQREFAEETGIATRYSDWRKFCEMGGENNDGENFEVIFYWSVGDVGCAKSQDEPLELVGLHTITPLRHDTIGNLPWLIAMARDFATGVHPPSKTVIRYDK
jgi:8-oxo-dGTP diphosphatase